jgi:hypothetical protein
VVDSWWSQQEQQLQVVLVETLQLVAQAQLPAPQHQEQLTVLCKAWARRMRGAAAAAAGAGAASHTVLQWLQQQQLGGAEAQQGPLLLLSQQVDDVIAVDMCCLQEQAAAGKLPADKAATAMSGALQLAAEMLPAGWQQPHWEAQVQLLRAVHSMQESCTTADAARQLAAACDMFGAITGSQGPSDGAAAAAAAEPGGGRGGGAGSSKRRAKKQPALPQDAEAPPEDRRHLLGLLSSSGLAHCLQGVHLHHHQQQQQGLSATQPASKAGSSSTTTATDEADCGTPQPAAALADSDKIRLVLSRAAGAWLRCCYEVQAMSSTRPEEDPQQQQQACCRAWRLPMQCAAAAAEAVSVAGSRGWLQLEQQLRQVSLHLVALQEVQQQQAGSSGSRSRSKSSSSSHHRRHHSSSSRGVHWLGQVLGGVDTHLSGVTHEREDLADVMGGMSLDEHSSSSSGSSSQPVELLAAAYRALHTGDTLSAVHSAEAAAKKCGYRPEPTAKSSTAADSSNACASARWEQLQSYCACCWLLGQLQEVLGQPDDALCWFKELQQLAAGLSSAPLCAVAASASAWLQGRRGDAARAMSALQNAQRHWEQWQLELAGEEEATTGAATAAAAAEGGVQQQQDPGHQLLCTVVHSWVLAAQAELALQLQEVPAAAAHLQSALEQLSSSQGSAEEEPQEEHICSSLVVMAVQQQAALRSRLAHCKSLQGDMAGAGKAVLEGVQQLEAAAQQLCRCVSHVAIHSA